MPICESSEQRLILFIGCLTNDCILYVSAYVAFDTFIVFVLVCKIRLTAFFILAGIVSLQNHITHLYSHETPLISGWYT